MPLRRIGHRDDWPTLGWEVIDWIEAYLPHGPGDIQGDAFELDDEEVRLLLDLYRIHPRDHARAGRRLVSRGIYSRPKGRRKSELAGAIVCAEALGPVRFDGWRDGGDPVARPVRAPFIRCLATEETQAGNTYDNVTVMLDHAGNAHPDVFAGVDLGRGPQGSTRVYLPGNGEIRPSTASSAAKDGGKETFAVPDETHLYVLPELKGMHRTVSRNMAKRRIAEPWMLETTTGFRPGEGSIAESGINQALKKAARGLYLNHREGSAVEKWSDDDQLMASLREAYGSAAEWMDLERILHEEIRSPEAEEADSRRYWLNQSRHSASHAFDIDRWRSLAQLDRQPARGERITAGFDGARFRDATALIGTTLSNPHQFVLGIWERPSGAPDDWEVDVDEVDGAVSDMFGRYKVLRLYADPPYWEEPIDRWCGRWGDKRVHRWWTHRKRPMAFALRAYAAGIRTGAFSQDGDPDFERHVSNARRRDTAMHDDDGKALWVIGKESPNSPLKIDAAMAGCLSWEAHGDAVAEGALREQREPRIW